MTAVFSHGRLRLYLLKLLAEGPKHGYELIRLLENRFLGLYAPSAGTIYPRLARMEVEGLVSHTAAGGRKVYEITDAGRAELAARADELAALESEIHASVADLTTLAQSIEREVSGSVRDIKQELSEASRRAGAGGRPWSRGRPEQGWDWSRGGRSDRDWAAGWRGSGGSGAAEQGNGERGAGQRGRGRAERDRDERGREERGGGRDEALDELAEALSELARDAWRMVRKAGAGESQIRTATAVVRSALTELRRLLQD